MNMKLSTINLILGILAGVKINKIEDKACKSALMQDYLALRKAFKQADEEKNELIRKFQEDWKDELPKVEAYRKEGKPVVGHLEYLEAEKDANKAIQDLFDKEVELSLTAVPFDALSGISDEITLEQVAILKENGIIS